MGVRWTHSHSTLQGNQRARQTSSGVRGHTTDTIDALDSSIIDCCLNWASSLHLKLTLIALSSEKRAKL
jgi:hypothetical protein